MERFDTLKKQKDFKSVFNLGKAHVTPLFVVYVKENNSDRNRYGYAVGKKIGNAVLRNRFKRLLREVVRRFTPSLESGFDVVFVARSAGVGKTYQDFDIAFSGLIEKAGLLKKSKRIGDI